MNDMIEMLKTRRSAPPATLSGPGPAAQEIEDLLAIASRVPDHGKLAPWRFIVFDGDARERAGAIIADVYARTNPGAGTERKAAEQTRLSLAPLVIAVVSRAAPHPKISEWEQILSAGAACMNLVIAANALGFAAAWLTEWYAYSPEVLARLGVRPDEKIAGFIHIGRNDATREAGARRYRDAILRRCVRKAVVFLDQDPRA